MIILWLCWFLYSKAKPWCIQCLCNKRKSLCYNFLFCILVSGSCSPRDFYFFTTVRQNLVITHCETVYATIIICLTMQRNGYNFGLLIRRSRVRKQQGSCFYEKQNHLQKLIPPPKLDSFSRYCKSNACLNLISLGNIKNSKNFCVEDP